MTLYGLLASLAWTASAVFFVSRSSAVASRWLELKGVSRSAAVPADVPDDLVALAMMESERHAQDSTMDAIREAFVRYNDWNKVRAAMGIGEMS